MRKIFSAPLRLFVGRTERENMDFQSISNFLVQRLGRERGQRREGKGRRGESSKGVISVLRRDPLPLSLYLFLSLGIASFLIPDNARARFPARLSHIKRQQCLNPFIIFPPRVLSISPSIPTTSTLARSRTRALPSSSPPPSVSDLECVRSALENINSFGKQERKTHSSDSMIGGGRRGDFFDHCIRPICDGIDSLRKEPFPSFLSLSL